MEQEQYLDGLLGNDAELAQALKLEMDEIKSLISFGDSEAGKKIISQREMQVIKIINRLLSSLYKQEDQNIVFYISQIAQLKVAIRDLVDFKGCKSSLEERQIILDTILKKKS